MPDLSERQRAVLRAVVTAYVGQAAPIGSGTISHLLAQRLSAASIRTTLAELSELGFVHQPHTSAGRVPTDEGLRVFIDALPPSGAVSEYDRRTIDFAVATTEPGAVAEVASELLSRQTRLLGFALAPRLDRLKLRHIALVRLGARRILAVLVTENGAAHRRVVEHDAPLTQAELDRLASLLGERVDGRTLLEVRELFAAEAQRELRQADRMVQLAFELGARAVAVDEVADGDLVIATRLALLDQPEFRDPERIRELFTALETKERLVELLDRLLARSQGVRVALGGEVDEPSLHRCALVAARYGEDGALGVIGPARMDYGRVISLVDYCSRVVTEKLHA
ncbi:MAG TPA: heat-inducible transcriptional repressor HrcA [Myxococcota bacterium]|nr:heat-inducible transcriptional repressor HrcA [Myxococcota bacterium]